MAVHSSKTVSITSGRFTLDEIAEFVESARNAGAKGGEPVSIRSYAGDRPWESGQDTITVTISGGKD